MISPEGLTVSGLVDAAESILLDNMTPAGVKKAVKQIRAALPNIPIEASGNMNLKTVRDYALTGVDFVSVGAVDAVRFSVALGAAWPAGHSTARAPMVARMRDDSPPDDHSRRGIDDARPTYAPK